MSARDLPCARQATFGLMNRSHASAARALPDRHQRKQRQACLVGSRLWCLFTKFRRRHRRTPRAGWFHLQQRMTRRSDETQCGLAAEATVL